MLRRRVIGGLAASAAIGGRASAQDDWAKVADAARKEGKLVIYTASIGSPSLKAVTKEVAYRLLGPGLECSIYHR